MGRFGCQLIALGGVAVLASGAAHAELGGPLASVAVDGGRIGAHMVSTPMNAYMRHDLTRANGGLVHELTNANGEVFAVTWSGPGKPDLRALLGASFPAFQTATAGIGRTMRALRRPASEIQPDLQVQTEGHMGWFHGVAFLRSLAPPGFSADELPRDR